MGHCHTDIELSNPKLSGLERLTVRAMADTVAMTLCIPEPVSVQLQLEEVERREVTVADGRRTLVPYAGPVQVRFKNRSCFVGALVLGDEVLLGAVSMEDMDLVLCPARRSVDVNPQSPNFPQARVK
ncbi:MAG: clan AA aspartic protease [Methylococcus sp.]